MIVVIREVARSFGVTEDQLLGNQRWHPLATARHVAMALCLEFYPMESTISVARYFRRHRSMCVHAIKKVDAIYHTNAEVYFIVGNLRARLRKKIDRKQRRAQSYAHGN
jgi:chromosomal replication initiation ATPase DnaA